MVRAAVPATTGTLIGATMPVLELNAAMAVDGLPPAPTSTYETAPARSNDVTDAFASTYPLVTQRNVFTDHTSSISFFLKRTRAAMDEMHRRWSAGESRKKVKGVIERYFADVEFLKNVVFERDINPKELLIYEQLTSTSYVQMNPRFNVPLNDLFYQSLFQNSLGNMKSCHCEIDRDVRPLQLLELMIPATNQIEPKLAAILNASFVYNLSRYYSDFATFYEGINEFTDDEWRIILDPVAFKEMLISMTYELDMIRKDIIGRLDRKESAAHIYEQANQAISTLGFGGKMNRLSKLARLQNVIGLASNDLVNFRDIVSHDYGYVRIGHIHSALELLVEKTDHRALVRAALDFEDMHISPIFDGFLLPFLLKNKNIHFLSTSTKRTLRFSERLRDKRELILRLFENLASNGEKYSDEGRIRKSVNFHWDEETGELVYKDNGIGMPQEFADRLGRGEQMRGPNVGDVDGSGIGWTVIGGVMRELGWTWTIKSAVGVGTEIRIKPQDADVIHDDGSISEVYTAWKDKKSKDEIKAILKKYLQAAERTPPNEELNDTYKEWSALNSLIDQLTDEEMTFLFDPSAFDEHLIAQAKMIDDLLSEFADRVERGDTADEIEGWWQIAGVPSEEAVAEKFERLRAILGILMVSGFGDPKTKELFGYIGHDLVKNRLGTLIHLTKGLRENDTAVMRKHIVEYYTKRTMKLSKIFFNLALPLIMKKSMEHMSIDIRSYLTLNSRLAGERDLIIRVIENVLANSAKYKKIEDLLVMVFVSWDKETSEFVIKDDGRGMPQEFADKLGHGGQLRGPNVKDVDGDGIGWDFIGKALTKLGWTWKIRSSDTGPLQENSITRTEIRIKPKDGDVIVDK